MGKELKRVPLDFDYPLGKIWAGYCNPFYWAEELNLSDEIKDKYGDSFENIDPPTGDGFQLWETTSEGSPQSPVFKTIDELCAWCESNATTFGSFKASKEKWKEMLSKDFVHHQEGNFTFI
jgi:hypothetical protein